MSIRISFESIKILLNVKVHAEYHAQELSSHTSIWQLAREYIEHMLFVYLSTSLFINLEFSVCFQLVCSLTDKCFISSIIVGCKNRTNMICLFFDFHRGKYLCPKQSTTTIIIINSQIAQWTLISYHLANLIANSLCVSK